MKFPDDYLGKVIQGDCLIEMGKLPGNSIDSIVCDPPYGLQFMGKHWDYDVPKVETWREVLRVLNPGGYLLSFFGTRTYHRGVIAIEDAGFEIRDQIGWLYASGFPKSQNISKAIDKTLGLEREKIRTPMGPTGNKYAKGLGYGRPWMDKAAEAGYHEHDGDIPVSEQAKAWDGWGTALKPAWEPICVARKPISEATVATNVLKWGTGGINIDGCRVGYEARHNPSCKTDGGPAQVLTVGRETVGRWPANVIHDGSEEVTAGFPDTGASKAAPRGGTNPNPMDWGNGRTDGDIVKGHTDNGGSAARFFYTAKASKWDRNEDCEGLEEKELKAYGDFAGTAEHASKQNIKSKNHHPTVKPTDLMQYLCRLVTPPNGIIIDPYSGSGSTGKAALLECFRFIGFERESEYCKIANARISLVKGQLKLF